MKRFIIRSLLMLMLMPMSAAADTSFLKVVVTFSLLEDLTKEVGGSLIDVKALVGPDSDAHTYKPTPDDLKTLSEADLVIKNGLGFEGWIDRLISASGYKGPVAVASANIIPRPINVKNRQIIDSHAWQDISNARVYIRNINAALDNAVPGKAMMFDASAKAYDAELVKLDQWVKAQIEPIPVAQRKIVTSHDAFGYFGAAYGIHFLAPEGISTEVEPTATDVGKLVEQIQVEKIGRVFFENMVNPKLVSQLAKDTNASLGKPIYSDALSAAGGPAATYVEMVRYNVTQFKEAMLMNGK